MKILYHHRTLLAGGGSVHIQRIVDELRKQGHEVLVDFEFPSNAVKYNLYSTLRRNLPKFFEEVAEIFFNFFVYKNLKRIVKKSKPDFIYARYGLFDYAPVLISRKYKVPLILEVNSPLAYERKMNEGLIFFSLAKNLEKKILNSASRVVIVSETLRTYFVSRGFDEKHFSVIPNAVTSAFLATPKKDTDLLKHFNLENCIVIGYLGFLQSWHRLDVLFKSFKMVLKENSACRLMLVGDGPLRSQLEDLARKEEIFDKVIFVGQLKHEDVPKYMSLFDLAVLPDCPYYCSPMKLIEGMAMKIPFIVPNKRSIKEIITHKKNGYVLKQSNPNCLARVIIELIRNPVLRSSLGRNARETVLDRNMLWQENATKIISIFQELSVPTVQKKIVMLLSNPCDPDPRVINEARALADAGNFVKVLAWDRQLKSKHLEKLGGIEIERIVLKSTYGRGIRQIFAFLRFNLRLFSKLLKLNFDVVHCHDFDTLLAGFFAAKLKRKKVVYDSHEYYSALMQDITPPGVSSLLHFAETCLLNRIDYVLVVNEKIKELFMTRGARHVSVVMNSKNLEDYEKISQSDVNELRNSLKLAQKTLLLYIGNLSTDRNLLQLAELIRSNNSVFLIIGGEGALKDKIMKLAKNSNNMLYLGKVDYSKVPLLTKAADINLAVYNSESVNNLLAGPPNKLFESIAAGTPILTSKDGVTGKLVQKLRCGVVVDPENLSDIKKKLFDLIQDKKKLNSIKKQILKIQSEFDWREEKLKLVTIYERL